MISGQSLTCPKGTSLTFEIDMDTGSDLTGATAQWALAESWFDQAKVYLTKTGVGDGLFINQDAGIWKITVNIAPADTLDVPSGLLFHDCKVLLQSGDVEDVANGPFSLDPSVNILDTNAPITRNLHALQALGRPSQVITLTVGALARNLLATQSLGGLGQAASATVTSGSALVETIDFLAISSLPSDVSLSRASTASYLNSSGVLQTAAIDAARFDHDPATLAAKGILAEGQRTNILMQSDNFTDTGHWSHVDTTVAASGNNSPDGTADAFTLTIPSVASKFTYNAMFSVASGTYTGKIWARVTTGTGKVYIGLQNGTAVAQGCSLTTSWQRFSISYTHPGGTMYFVVGQKSDGSTTDASPSIEVFGAQVELGSFSTSRIPTTTIEVTRGADVLSSNSPLTGYLASGPSVWEFQDEATGAISRSAYATGAFDWPVYKWYRSMGVYVAGTDTSSHMTVGSAY